MRNGEPGLLLLENHLRLAVDFVAFGSVGHGFGFEHQVFIRLVAKLGDIGAVGFGRCAAQQGIHEVVRVTVVTSPSHHAHLVFTVLHALSVLAPFKAFDFGCDADLDQVCLHQLGNTFGVRVVRALHRHGPQVGAEAFGITGFRQQLFGGFRVVDVVLDGVVISRHGGRNWVLGRNAGAEVHAVKDGFFVDRHADGPPHPHIVKGLFRGVVGQVANIQARLLQNRDVGVFAHRLQVCRVGVRHDMAFGFLQLGPAHRCVRRDGVNKVVDFWLAAPVSSKSLVADDCVFLILQQ